MDNEKGLIPPGFEQMYTKEPKVRLVVFVDDLEERFERFTKRFPDAPAIHCKNSDDAILALHQFGVHYGGGDVVVWLDHDAGAVVDPWSEDNKIRTLTFRPVAVALAMMKFEGKVKLHSANADGRKWMEETLKQAKIHVENNTDPDVIYLWAEDGGEQE